MLWLGLRRVWGAGTRYSGLWPRSFTSQSRADLWPAGKVDKFGGVSVHLQPGQQTDEAAFRSWLQGAIKRWREEGRIAVWLHVPIMLSGLITYAASEGFTFHHAEHDTSTLTLWLKDGPSKLPAYATHQVGVAGAVLDEVSGKVLVVQDKNKIYQRIPAQYIKRTLSLIKPLGFAELLHRDLNTALPYTLDVYWLKPPPPPDSSLSADVRRDKDWAAGFQVPDPFDLKEMSEDSATVNTWKFPGGLSDPGEDIGATAVREVLEETGINSEFQSFLSIRQQHNHPGAFGKSDMYIICRLKPLSYSISFCPQECLKCEWMDLKELAYTSHTTPITSRIAKLLLYGYKEGFHNIDLAKRTFPAVYSGLFYSLYHKELPATYETQE